ncbi:lymphocyte antigen 6L isoform X2 [Arvicola amphibius]|uniref:lymphocyte antigen 6L isoform X2 n=1 Tax=Arvicola amphibius TaxID=1047088 RepID=UPI001C0A566C|nr:lymphocyte antigen 6L isoform X2 [Arvicola amphibius]
MTWLLLALWASLVSVELARDLATREPGTRSRTQISKACAVTCHNSNGVFETAVSKGIQARITRGCCSRNLCNRAPGAVFRTLPGRILLPLGLGLFHTLL